MKNKSVVIICGDPKSTFNEILIKTLKKNFLKNIKFPVIIIGSKKLLENESKKLKTNLNLQKFDSQTKLYKKKIYIIDIPLDLNKLSLIKKNEYIMKSFKVGLKLLKKKRFFCFNEWPNFKNNFS